MHSGEGRLEIRVTLNLDGFFSRRNLESLDVRVGGGGADGAWGGTGGEGREGIRKWEGQDGVGGGEERPEGERLGNREGIGRDQLVEEGRDRWKGGTRRRARIGWISVLRRREGRNRPKCRQK